MIKIVEVGPRDGLQNESEIVPADAKVEFVNALSKTGVSEIEVSAFISPKRIPQLKDAGEVFKKIQRRKNVVYSALVPNEKGLDHALEAGVEKISVFTAASETFNQKNINTSIKGALKRFGPVISRTVNLGLPVRAYISTAFWCAFEGKINPSAVVDLAQELMTMGVNEVSISDTIGKAAPDEVAELMDMLLPKVPGKFVAAHFHDTYGRGIANVLESVKYGICVIDASAGGLGGCPFAPGATGNVSTQDVVAALIKNKEKVAVDIGELNRACRILNSHLPEKQLVFPPPVTPACALCEFFDGENCCGKEK